MKTSIGFGLMALALVAAPVAAQQDQHQGDSGKSAPTQMGMTGGSMMGGMMGGMMGDGGMGMMKAMRYMPANVLKNKEALKLTADQVSRIEALKPGGMGSPGMAGMSMNEMPKQDMSMMKEMQTRQSALREAFDKSPADPAAIQAAAAQMATLHGKMMAEHLITAAKVRDLLTPAQREQVAKMPSPGMMDGAGMMPMGQPCGATPDTSAEHEQHHPPPSK